MSAPLPAFVRIHLLKTLQQPANILYDWSEVMMTQIAPMLAVSDEMLRATSTRRPSARGSFGN